MKILPSAFILVALVSSAAAAQDRGYITGRVLERATGNPVPHAIIDIKDVGTAVTDSSGRYGLYNIPVGRYAVRARQLGFAPSIDSVVVRGGSNQVRDFTLAPPRSELVQERGGEVLLRPRTPR